MLNKHMYGVVGKAFIGANNKQWNIIKCNLFNGGQCIICYLAACANNFRKY